MKGLDALGNRIANMTIGELEAMLDLQNIDLFTVVQLMKDLRSLYRTFVSVLRFKPYSCLILQNLPVSFLKWFII